MVRSEIIGERFGRLVAIKPTHKSKGGHWYWECQCDCGNIHTAKAMHLKNGHVQSCGCLRREGPHTTHGLRYSTEYTAFYRMHDRCYNTKSAGYLNYGGRGITVCDRWHTFENFYTDMGTKPSPELTLERIDNDKGYCKENCKWESRYRQNINKRNTKEITKIKQAIRDMI